MHSPAVLERLAATVLAEISAPPSVNALHLANAFGLERRPWAGPRGMLSGNVILYNEALPERALHAVVAHETAHWLLRDEGLDDDEESAVWLSHALLLPRRGFERDLRSTWNPRELQTVHAFAPVSWVARRIAQLRPVVATIIDDRRVVERYATRPLTARRRKLLTPREFELVAEALDTGRPAGGRLARGWAVPVLDHVQRVVVVAETRALAA
jgi:hypothetical protein